MAEQRTERATTDRETPVNTIPPDPLAGESEAGPVDLPPEEPRPSSVSSEPVEQTISLDEFLVSQMQAYNLTLLRGFINDCRAHGRFADRESVLLTDLRAYMNKPAG